ncbi:MAG: hypothetical protein JXA90_16450 [Planctomycetes bacterium]|nr:hypothetical protein [Planctomycetota bacterium]
MTARLAEVPQRLERSFDPGPHVTAEEAELRRDAHLQVLSHDLVRTSLQLLSLGLLLLANLAFLVGDPGLEEFRLSSEGMRVLPVNVPSFLQPLDDRAEVLRGALALGPVLTVRVCGEDGVGLRDEIAIERRQVTKLLGCFKPQCPQTVSIKIRFSAEISGVRLWALSDRRFVSWSSRFARSTSSAVRA